MEIPPLSTVEDAINFLESTTEASVAVLLFVSTLSIDLQPNNSLQFSLNTQSCFLREK